PRGDPAQSDAARWTVPSWSGRGPTAPGGAAVRVSHHEWRLSVPVAFPTGLKCRVCGKTYPKQPLNFCTDDFGPLEVDYDYEAVAEALSRAKIELRPATMWRYRELLPLDGEPTVGPQVGGTPLVRADRLADALGVEKLWIKND